ncbi:MAG: glycosyltransferase [Actinobacteria bacterium]|nr:glycosyltransferase [Actinomycetota bacterium]
MRILILHSRYLSGSASGENRVVEDEAQLLRSAGHEVEVLSPSPEVSGSLGRMRAGVEAVWSRTASAEVVRSVRERGVQIVHAHNLFPTLSPAVLRAAGGAGAATVMTLHNYRLMCLPADFLREGEICEACLGHVPWRGVAYRCYRESRLASAALAVALTAHRVAGTFEGVTCYLAVSDFVRRKHVQAGLPADRIQVKANFSWEGVRRSGPGDYFLFLGRLAHEKDVDTVISACALGEPLGRLLIVGGGPEESRLRARDVPGVEFRGQVPPEEVPALLANARALLVPSRWYEAAPRSITEAYAAGVPVVASDIGALPEAVSDGLTGFLAPPRDPGAWAVRARRLLEDAESERLGAGARRRWEERHSPERGLLELEAAYRAALSTRSGAR